MIHPTAIIQPGAVIGEGVRIGPWCTVGPDVIIEDGVELISHVVVDGHTRIGAGVRLFPFVSAGLEPQDLKYKGEPTRCEIGPRTVVREHVTIHRGTTSGAGLTKVGADCLIMANAHIAHDCELGDRVIIVNNVVMGGHVHIDDDARVMGSAAIHQFVRIGRAAMIGGVTGVEADVIPYGSVMGNRARLVGLHWVWLRRNGVPSEEMHIMRRAWKMLYPQQETEPFSARLEHTRRAFGDHERVAEILTFIETQSRRGLVKSGNRNAPGCEEQTD